jgi:NAD(P)-dependent dehydrogenase (short-subunit alcohol dehydrogenase family)
LRDREPLCGAPEVQLLGDGDEVSQLPSLHQVMLSGDDHDQYPCGIAAHPIGLGRSTRHRSRIGGVSEQTIALVTGANKGIGYEIAAGLGALGWRIGVGARDRQRRDTAVEKLRAAGTDAFGVPLDVTDDASVAAAAELIADQAGGLDVLVNNAAITGGLPQTPTTVDPATVRIVVETNVIGVVRVTNAVLPMLRASASPRIVNMSSSVGSLALQTTPGIDLGQAPAAYLASKTFLNALTVQYVKELGDTNILINSGCPGFTATDLNGFRGVRTPQQGAAIAIRLATLPDDGPTGGFFDDAGTVPW